MINKDVARCIRNIELLIIAKNITLNDLKDIKFFKGFNFKETKDGKGIGLYKVYPDHCEATPSLFDLYQLSELLDTPINNLIHDDLEGNKCK